MSRTRKSNTPACISPTAIGHHDMLYTWKSRGVNSHRQTGRGERGAGGASSTDIFNHPKPTAALQVGVKEAISSWRHEAESGRTIRKRGPCKGDDDVRAERGYRRAVRPESEVVNPSWAWEVGGRDEERDTPLKQISCDKR